MDGYICTKGLTLSGAKYAPGDTIPAEAVLPHRVRALKNQGYIATRAETAATVPEPPQEPEETPAPIVIPLTRDGGVFELVTGQESIVACACNLQLTAEKAVEVIQGMEDGDALVLIHALDSRKTVKAAAQARAEELEQARAGEEGQGGA